MIQSNFKLIDVTLKLLLDTQALSIRLVSMIQSNFKLIDVTLKLLLDTQSLSLCSLFCFKRGTKRLHSTLVVLTGVVELLLLLSGSSINFLADLAELKLCSEDLVLLLLKSSLSFFQSGLELLFLLLKSSALFVKIMNGASTITKLVEQILDLISQVLVFTLDNVQLFKSLILSRLQSEQLRAVVATLILRGLNFSSNISCLGLPFSKNLVKVLTSLLSNKS